MDGTEWKDGAGGRPGADAEARSGSGADLPADGSGADKPVDGAVDGTAGRVAGRAADGTADSAADRVAGRTADVPARPGAEGPGAGSPGAYPGTGGHPGGERAGDRSPGTRTDHRGQDDRGDREDAGKRGDREGAGRRAEGAGREDHGGGADRAIPVDGADRAHRADLNEQGEPRYAGHYRLEARLGSGGMGVVHLARSTSGLRLAVKVVHARHAEDPEFRARFRQEVAAARRVSGAFTAPVVDADPEAERPWMATLYIPGQTLAEHVRRYGPLEPDTTVRLAAGLAEALRDIHRAGLVHRDLKPSNVLLAEDGPKVIDFGISRPTDSELRTETGKLIGTPPFMAPEQFQRPRQVGFGADVFALGSVLVHAATGRGPFDGESPYLAAYQVVHNEPDLTEVPEPLVPLLRACLAKEPGERPTPDALMATLREMGSADGPWPHTTVLRLPAQRTAGPDELAAGRPGGPGSGAERPDGSAPAPDTPAFRAAPVERPTGEPASTRRPGPARSAEPSAHDPDHDPDHDPARGSDQADRADLAHASGRGPRAGRSDRGAAAGRHWVRWAAVGAAAAVTISAGAVWGVHKLSGGASGRAGARQAASADGSGRAGRGPWATSLRPPATASGGTTSGRNGKASASTGGSPLSFCTYGEGALYCVQRDLEAARLDPADGHVVWSRPGFSHRSTPGATVAPVFSGGLVQVISPDGTVVQALDPRTGHPRWHRDLSAYHGRVYQAGDTLLLISPSGTVTGVDARTGRTRWRHAVPGQVAPVFSAYDSGRTAYAITVADDGMHTQVAAVDTAHGTVRWHRTLAGNLTPVGDEPGGDVEFMDQDRRNQVTAVVRYDPADHTVRRAPLTTPVTATSVVTHGDTAYLMCDDGALVAVDTDRTGGGAAERWRLETSVSNASALVASGDRLYFSAADGRLVAVDTRRPRLLGQTRPRPGRAVQGYLASVPAPVAADGKVFAAAPDGTVFAVDASDPDRW